MRRRTLLGGLGLGLGALSLPSLAPRGARAEPGVVRRLLVVMTEHGVVYPRWRLRPGGLGDDADWEVPLAGLGVEEFSDVLRPLHEVRDRLIVLDGLGLASAQLTAENQHKVGHATALTGSAAVPVQGGLARAEGPSIDQVVAQAIAAPGQIASLQVSHGSWPYSHDAGGLSLPAIVDPGELHAKLFPGASGGTAPPTSELAKIRAQQHAVASLVRDQYAAVADRLGGEDRRKVEQHRDLLGALALQLEHYAELVCQAPPAPEAGPPAEDLAWYEVRAQLFTTMIALALSCDLTRVAVLSLWGLRSEHLGAPPGDLHNDYAHAVSVDPVAEQVMVDFGRRHAEDLRRVIDALAQIPSEGGTLLDDTLVVWASELGSPEHGFPRWPVVLAGGDSFFAGAGRYLRFREPNLVPGAWGDAQMGPPHNRLLVSIARALGAAVDQVGRAAVPLQGGGVLSCTGPLERLG